MPKDQYSDSERILLSSGIKAERLLGGLEGALFRKILKFLHRFDTQGGRFLDNESSREILTQLNKELGQLLTKSQVSEFMKAFQTDFDSLGENIRYLHNEENAITVPKQLVNAHKAQIVTELSSSLFGAGYDARFAEPVKKVLYNHINFGANVIEAERALRVLVYGKKGNSGLLSKHAGTVARDSMRQFQGRINKQVEKEYGLEYIRYVGNIIADSRWQCRRWVEMGYLHKDDLGKEVRQAFRSGSGMIPGTTKDTFMIYLGGYNCMHQGFPVRKIER